MARKPRQVVELILLPLTSLVFGSTRALSLPPTWAHKHAGSPCCLFPTTHEHAADITNVPSSTVMTFFSSIHSKSIAAKTRNSLVASFLIACQWRGRPASSTRAGYQMKLLISDWFKETQIYRRCGGHLFRPLYTS